MSLKSIFELALTTDKRYNTGDISEKTGLQKQPDGSWKPPKGSSAEKHQKALEKAAPEGKWQNSDALDFVHKLPPLNEAKTEQLFEAQDKLDDEWIAKKGNVDKERFEQVKTLIKGELARRGTTGRDYWAYKKATGDSAPRILTGDTKIIVKKN